MNFVSSEFVLLLIATVAVCAMLRGRAITVALVIASFIFYGWWNPPYLVLLLAVIAISWAGGLWIERRRTPLVMWAVVLAELALLVYFKYAGFLVANAGALGRQLGLDWSWHGPAVLLPAGISFMTFQGVAYAVDVYRGEITAERSLLSMALFKSFFPQLVAGPIERAAHLMPQLRRLEREGLRRARFAEGTFMLLKGMLYKFVIADNLSVVVDGVYRNVNVANPLDVFCAVIAFSIQIYGDFYGYTLLALGSALLLGVELVPNFNHPYAAVNIQDFWRRWHMSLSHWFRDYVYKPLGGSRQGLARHALNLGIVMLAVGLWHGANWTFVLWGALHGGLLAAHAGYRRLLNRDSRPGSPVGRVFGWALTLIIVTLLWIPFRASHLDEPVVILQKLYQFMQAPTSFTSTVYALQFYVWIAVGFVVLETIDCVTSLELGFARLPAVAQCGVALSLLLLSYLGPAKDVAFLYFQF